MKAISCCCSSNTLWIVHHHHRSQRNWYIRNDAVTSANVILLVVIGLYQLGFLKIQEGCKTHWDYRVVTWNNTEESSVRLRVVLSDADQC